MNQRVRAAGITILRHAYKTCEDLAVPRDEIADLFLVLAESVVAGESRMPDCRTVPVAPAPVPRVVPPHITAEDREMILHLHTAGYRYMAIAARVHVDRYDVEAVIAASQTVSALRSGAPPSNAD